MKQQAVCELCMQAFEKKEVQIKNTAPSAVLK